MYVKAPKSETMQVSDIKYNWLILKKLAQPPNLDSTSTALSAELRAHRMECDYYSRFVLKFEWEFTGLSIPIHESMMMAFDYLSLDKIVSHHSHIFVLKIMAVIEEETIIVFKFD